MRPECKIPAATLQAELDAGGTYASIARRHGFGAQAIRFRCVGLGLQPSRAKRGAPPSEAVLRIALGVADVSLPRLAARFECSVSALKVAARRYGLPTSPDGRAALREARR
ncbi:hypothetical protein [uncultured Methylobacterium sp.]|jgi:transposase-like protein|uniref:hypothetical protein n=1 Tax=uncultured Methylobacterium sp. TaxID=157278 RepID=UPI00261F0DF3|nr:hypothetical protein [uncultured Methylobacterium sp.]